MGAQANTAGSALAQALAAFANARYGQAENERQASALEKALQADRTKEFDRQALEDQRYRDEFALKRGESEATGRYRDAMADYYASGGRQTRGSSNIRDIEYWMAMPEDTPQQIEAKRLFGQSIARDQYRDTGSAITNVSTGETFDKDLAPDKTPEYKADVATAEAEAEKAFTMKGANEFLDEAETILDRGEATASGAGTIADAAASFVGQTLPGAEDAARLKAVGGWLTSKVPRMEGPQSDFDRQYYQDMAGSIGDSTIPLAQRKAALQTVRGILSGQVDLPRGSSIVKEPDEDNDPLGLFQ